MCRFPRRCLGIVTPVALTVAIVALTEAPQSTPATEQVGDVVRLRDAKHNITVSVLPSVGNVAIDMTVKGKPVLRFPYASVDDFKKAPRLNAGIPFLAPWANRLDEQGFYANGRHYTFNAELGNVRGARPIHGFLTFAPWRVIEAKATGSAAWVTSRLEFYREPDWTAQFPFAHTIEMTYRLRDGALEVSTRIQNLSTQPMPVSIGFHPYFQLTDSLRDEWTVSVGARTQWLLSPEKIPTGDTRPIEQAFPDPKRIALGDFDLDDVFGDLVRDSTGRAVMSVRGRSQRLDVIFGPNYRAAVIYAPSPNASRTAATVPNRSTSVGTSAPPSGPANSNQPAQDRNYICFEPMAGITNAMNMAHRGLYKELQSIAPGGIWQESFWIRPSGF